MKTYIILRNGEELGIFTRRQLKKKILAGDVVSTDKMQQSGTKSWIDVGKVPKLSNTFLETSSTGTKKDRALTIDPASVDIDPEDQISLRRDKNYDSLLDSEPIEDVFCIETKETNFLEAGKPKKEPSVASSELARATIFATRNFLRRSIFIQQTETVKKTGYVFQGLGILALGITGYAVAKNSGMPSLVTIPVFAWGILAIVGVASTILCGEGGSKIIASSPTYVRENSTLELAGLTIITSGIAVLVGLSIIAFTTGSVWPVVYGVLALFASVLSAGLVLSPSISNVEFNDVSQLKESVHTLVLLSKVSMLLGPFVFSCCSAIAVIQSCVLIFGIWSTEGAAAQLSMSIWTGPGMMFLIAGYFTLAAYLCLFVLDTISRLVR